MAAENDFLAALVAYLQGAKLAPAPTPKTVGVAEPADGVELPAVVLSLESTSRAGNGLGERSALITGGILPWQAAIDLANPVLPEDTSFRLLDVARQVLSLPHGGLVKQDGSSGPLTAADLTVKVAGTGRPVVAGPPTDDQVSADPTVGQLTFATALPAAGNVEVTYFLGQWEQRLTRIAGTLRVDVCAAQTADAAALSGATVEALLAPGARSAIHRLLALGVTALSSIGAPEPPLALRRRTARFSFIFENEINQPDSSGGIIARIPITTELVVA